MSELWSDFLGNRGRIISKWPHYFPVYERHFAKFKNTPCTVLELGIAKGGSLQMWKRYFGPLARIVGIDIDPNCTFKEPQIETFIGDQSHPDFLAGVLEKIGIPDIVVDDGSHRAADIRASFSALYPAVSESGVYVVEDLHTAYWDEFGPESFIDTCRGMLDGLNAHHIRNHPGVKSFTLSTQSMHFYDSMVVFEKGQHPVPAEAISSGALPWTSGS